MANRAYTVQVNVVGDSSGAQQAVKKVGDQADRTSGHLRSVIGGTLSTVSGALGGALGPISEAFEHIDSALDVMGEKAHSNAQKIGAVMTGVGASAVGMGSILTAAGSKDQQAKAQLQQAIQDVGGSYEDFADRIESTNSRMAKFGYTADESMNAIQALTQGLHDPAKALDLMGTAANVAAAKHESLNEAATQLVQWAEGKGTKSLLSLGINTAATAKSAQELTKAQKDQLKAADALSTAQQKLANLQAQLSDKSKLSLTDQQALAAAQQNVIDIEARLHDKKTVTLADQQALAKAQAHLQDLMDIDHQKGQLSIADQQRIKQATENVTTAQQNLAQANVTLKNAQNGAAAAGKNHGDVLAQVAQVTNGQANAAADSFAGHMRALRAEVENQVATLGQKYGPALTGAGAGLSVLGSVITGTSSLFKKLKQDSSDTAGGVKKDAESMRDAQKDMGNKAVTAAGEEAGLAATEKAAGDSAATSTGEVAALGGAEQLEGTEAATAASEEYGLAASEKAAGAAGGGLGGGLMAGGAGLVTTAGVGAGIVLVGASLYNGAVQGINPSSIPNQVAYADSFGLNATPAQANMPTLAGISGLSPNLSSAGGLSGLANIPRRAGGGPVSSGQPYWVGEVGPEIFVPSSSGTIVPLGTSSGGSPVTGGGSSGGDLTVELYLNDRKFADAIIPAIRTRMLQGPGRNSVRIGLS